jgi:hypothetical protein
MQLEINSPKLEALIAARLESGSFHGIEDILLQALDTPLPMEKKSVVAGKRRHERRSLAALFADSPFKGLDLCFDRETDTGRSIRL